MSPCASGIAAKAHAARLAGFIRNAFAIGKTNQWPLPEEFSKWRFLEIVSFDADAIMNASDG